MLSDIEKNLLNNLYVLSDIKSNIKKMPNIYKVSEEGKKWLNKEIKLIEEYFTEDGVMDSEGVFVDNPKGEKIALYWNWLEETEEGYDIWQRLDQDFWNKIKSM